jgi:beta-fructofuranosidase
MMRVFANLLPVLLLFATSDNPTDSSSSPFRDAVAVWHLRDLRDSAGKVSDLTSRGGAVRLGVALTGADREASLRRGGDGLAAEFRRGCLDAGQGKDGELNLAGHAFSLAIRLRDPSGQWNASLLSKHGGHDKLVYNLFTVDLGAGMILGFELGTDRGMAQVTVPIREIGSAEAWHDIIARYDGKKVDLFIDGALRDSRPWSGELRTKNTEPCLLGAESTQGNPIRPFHGWIDHAALWSRTLSDDEVVFLSGGITEVAARRTELAARLQQAHANANVAHREAVSRANSAVAKAVARADADKNRPTFHFQAPALWMNDPNGPLFYKGEYHLFYQHNPYGEEWDHMHWGHAKSKDLVNWEHLPIAIAPSLELGEEHCFSGCAVVNNGVPTLLYTSIGPRAPAGDGAVQWVATSKDDMLTFEKHPANPVMTGDLHSPAGIVVKDWRDPFAWRDGNTWYAVLGGHRDGGKGGAFLYHSKDLLKWEFVNTILEGEEPNWECPNLFRLGEKWVLIYSPHGPVRYYTGTLDAGHKFNPEFHGTIDHSPTYYAPNGLEDPSGRRLLWGWIRVKGQGWNGAFSLPRVLAVRPDGRLRIQPAPELAKLRGPHARRVDQEITPESPVRIDKVPGPGLEILAQLQSTDAAALGLAIRFEGGSGQTEIVFDRTHRRLRVGDATADFDLIDGETTLALHVFVDRSIIEVYVNDRECFTVPAAVAGVESLELFTRGGNSQVKSVDVWEMKPSEIRPSRSRRT